LIDKRSTSGELINIRVLEFADDSNEKVEEQVEEFK
jgi:hypothetical protein